MRAVRGKLLGVRVVTVGRYHRHFTLRKRTPLGVKVNKSLKISLERWFGSKTTYPSQNRYLK